MTLNRKIFFYLLLLLAVSLPLSIFATSVIQFLLGINWLVEGRFRDKWKRLTGDKAFLIYAVFYLVHIISMLWSADTEYGIRDLKIKLPLLLIPFIIVTSEELIHQEVRDILNAFIGATIIASFASILALVNILPVEISDFRDASLFIGHIRFSLMVVLSILFAAYFLFSRNYTIPKKYRYFYLFTLLWLPVFLIILRSLSGMIILLFMLLFLSFGVVRTVKDQVIRFMLTVVIILVPLFSIIYIGSAINRFYTWDPLVPGELDSQTINGNKYLNYIENKETENGHYVWIYVCPLELEREWNRISDIDYMGQTENGDYLRFTLIRYLTSLGYRKDSVGVHKLTGQDIEAIESGIANHIYLNRFDLYPRIYQVIWEFDRFKLGHSPNDKSIIQRYCYLQAGFSIAADNLLYGVGNGDVRRAFGDYYEKTNSPLRTERRRRAHNQFLTLAISFGIPGMLICLTALLFPVFRRKKWGSFMTVVFLLTMAMSMLDEDTLENTPGVVMFGLFYGIFIFGPSWKWKTKQRMLGSDTNE